eukprot:TRINITY_DN81220_c0_g1_i1.p1 TRINITY_DN81220_c0_g1~~TRINITY_DN81220_c0_g1_i1.p1  ORF type:complete len:259 (-),score=60.57 TRINITY_DN81220_c0_g1_i1:101-877(-)
MEAMVQPKLRADQALQKIQKEKHEASEDSHPGCGNEDPWADSEDLAREDLLEFFADFARLRQARGSRLLPTAAEEEEALPGWQPKLPSSAPLQLRGWSNPTSCWKPDLPEEERASVTTASTSASSRRGWETSALSSVRPSSELEPTEAKSLSTSLAHELVQQPRAEGLPSRSKRQPLRGWGAANVSCRSPDLRGKPREPPAPPPCTVSSLPERPVQFQWGNDQKVRQGGPGGQGSDQEDEERQQWSMSNLLVGFWSTR